MLKKTAKPLNHLFSLDADSTEKKPLGGLYNHVMHILVITALYVPLFWYASHLRTLYPRGTNLMDLHPLHLAVVICMLVTPLVILRLLGVKWRSRESAPPEV